MGKHTNAELRGVVRHTIERPLIDSQFGGDFSPTLV